jgi:hypothetical protein
MLLTKATARIAARAYPMAEPLMSASLIDLLRVKRFQTICELARERSSYFEAEEPIAATI